MLKSWLLKNSAGTKKCSIENVKNLRKKERAQDIPIPTKIFVSSRSVGQRPTKIHSLTFIVLVEFTILCDEMGLRHKTLLHSEVKCLLQEKVLTHFYKLKIKLICFIQQENTNLLQISLTLTG